MLRLGRPNLEPTLKQLRALVAAADAGQFTRAAERLNISQSAVSLLINQLEENLSLRLFDRHTRLLRLTEAGVEVLAVARRTLADIDSLVESAQDLNSLRRGRVSVAAGTLQAALLLPRLIHSFRQSHEQVDVSLHDVPERSVIDMVKSGAVDIGLGTVPSDDSEIIGSPLMTEAYLAVLRPEHPLAQRKQLRWQDLAGETLIRPQLGNPIRDRFETELARAGLSLPLHRAFQDVALPLTIIGMVDAGLGVAIMTATVIPLAESMGLRTLLPSDPHITRDISLIIRSDRSLSPAARQFKDFLHRSMQEKARKQSKHAAASNC
ncbi:LysR family transcriptional regulator [Xinfangfangia sp. CPCC 101601]|uniref:LysR family transcriptional regulator n=1 Tax=Pseudogemmobacter lacusdianii TaxID=3069608 RepID=A0ABU0W1Q1_9RHOB|nr:LysR family transcriptional regulator [Xinfangfangia sp. CPCC 101601]MDQ2067907.1 LysR family transcriptional regulator [Xinfangfangia sp. CPCC 101601]